MQRVVHVIYTVHCLATVDWACKLVLTCRTCPGGCNERSGERQNIPICRYAELLVAHVCADTMSVPVPLLSYSPPRHPSEMPVHAYAEKSMTAVPSRIHMTKHKRAWWHLGEQEGLWGIMELHSAL
jgi:hypothetical protein